MSFKIKKSKIRGVESFGMICAEDELGIGTSHDGIMVLEDAVSPGTPAIQALEVEEDFCIEIGLTPNRSDAMSHYGVARDLVAYWKLRGVKAAMVEEESSEIVKDSSAIEVKLEAEEACPYYTATLIEGVEVKDSPEWLKDKLEAIGLNPKNNIVDITNYVMHAYGNPLHAFDASVIGKEIRVKAAEDGQNFTALDERELTLTNNDLVICSADGTPQCLAGVMGGLQSGVKASTTDIVLEGAWFDPVWVRKSAKRHQTSSDSSFRFERGVDPNQVEASTIVAVNLIVELAGGKVVGGVSEEKTKSFDSWSVAMKGDKLRELIGAEIANDEIREILESLEYGVQVEADNFTVEVPTYRFDVTRPADLVEEVLRIYGFNQVAIPTKMSMSVDFLGGVRKENVKKVISDVLVSRGFLEAMNNSLTNSENYDVAESLVKIKNPLSQELDVMRASLLPDLVKSVVYNYNRQREGVSLFEFGKVYGITSKGFIEEERLNVMVSGESSEETWGEGNIAHSFYSIKGHLKNLMERLGFANAYSLKEGFEDEFGAGLEVVVYGKVIGHIAKLKPKAGNSFGLKKELYYVDLSWSNIVEFQQRNIVKFKEISKTQEVVRDLSLLVNDTTNYQQLEELAKKQDRKLLKRVSLFDVYEGDNLPEGHKSYAMRFVFQDEQKTLKDADVDKVMKKIIAVFEKNLSATLR